MIRLDGIELDTDSHEVRVNDQVVNLPLKEFELLVAADGERRPGPAACHADRPGLG